MRYRGVLCGITNLEESHLEIQSYVQLQNFEIPSADPFSVEIHIHLNLIGRNWKKYIHTSKLDGNDGILAIKSKKGVIKYKSEILGKLIR